MLQIYDHLFYKMYQWGDMSTEQLVLAYPRYEYYINTMPGSTENHTTLLSSGVHMFWFIKKITELVVGKNLPDNMIDYLPDFSGKKNDKPLCLIFPESISIKSLFTNDFLRILYDKYNKDYEVKIVTTRAPLEKISRTAHIYNLETMQCFDLLMTADLFIGNDSGMAWASMMNRKCKKIIFHRAARLIQTNCRYGAIDPNATDFVEE